MEMDKTVKATLGEACMHGIKTSAEELAQQIACGIHLGWFSNADAEQLVVETMQKVEDQFDRMTKHEVGSFYASKMCEALEKLIKESE